MQIVNPGVSPETCSFPSSSSPGGMAQRPGAEGCFLATLLAQWMAISSSPIQTGIPAEAALRADLEQEDSSHQQPERDRRLATGALTAPAPEVVHWVIKPSQGELSDELQMKEEQEATREGLLTIVTSSLPMAGLPASPWTVPHLLSPTGGGALDATSDPSDAIELPTMAYAAWQPQAAVWPQAEQPGKLGATTWGAPEGATRQAQAIAQPQKAVQGEWAQVMAQQPGISLLPRGEESQAQAERRLQVTAHDGLQAAPNPSTIAPIGWPVMALQRRPVSQLATGVSARRMADEVAPAPMLARSTMPPKASLPIDVYQSITEGDPRIQQIGQSATVRPELLPSERLAMGQPAVLRWPMMPEPSSPMAQLVIAEGPSVQADIRSRPQFELTTTKNRPAPLREAVPAIPWDDQHPLNHPGTGQVSPKAVVPLAEPRLSDAEAHSAASNLETGPQSVMSPANVNSEVVIVGAEFPHQMSQPMAQQALLEGDVRSAEPRTAGLRHREEQASGQEGDPRVGDEGALTPTGKVSVASPAKLTIQGDKAARWETRLEAGEVPARRAPFPVGQVMAQSANLAATDQQAMRQAGSERQQASALALSPGELAPARPPSSPVTHTVMELGTMVTEEPWQRADQSRSAEDSVRPSRQVPLADAALGLPGPIRSPAATERTHADEEVTPDRAALRMFYELVDRVYVALQRGEPEWRLQLRPHHLGHLEIRLSTGAHGVTLLMRAETPEAQTLIQANLDQLRNGLMERGVQLERCEVMISHPGAEGSGLAGHFGGWEGMTSRSYEGAEFKLARQVATLQPRDEPIAAARGASTNRACSLIDLQA